MASGGQHSYLVETKSKSIHLWHRWLGHLGLKNVQKLENLVRGMKISEKQKGDHDFVCGHCQKARHSKHPFRSYGIRTSAPFEIVYSDICGLFQLHIADPNTLSHLLMILHDLLGHFALNLETKYTKSTKNSEVW